MEIREITEEKKNEWDGFLLRNCPEAFLQSYGWGEFQIAVGRKVFRFACYGKTMLAAAAAVEHKLPFGQRYWYVPRGPVLAADAAGEDIAGASDALLAHLRVEAKKVGAIFVRMDPPLAADDKGRWERPGLRKVAGSVQPPHTLLLNLAQSEEELLSQMKPKARYNTRFAEKKGIEVGRERFSEEGFEIFWRLMEETSRRDSIVSHSRAYYREMLRSLDKEEGALRCSLYVARYQGKPLAANLVLIFGGYAVYLHGTSSDTLRNLKPTYLLQWRQIQDAKAAGCRTYDFWGITRDNERPKWAGITRFKKGFGGTEKSYVGVYDLAVDELLYGLYARLRRLR